MHHQRNIVFIGLYSLKKVLHRSNKFNMKVRTSIQLFLKFLYTNEFEISSFHIPDDATVLRSGEFNKCRAISIDFLGVKGILIFPTNIFM